MSRSRSNYVSIVHFDEHLISRLRVRKSSKGVDVIGFDQERGQWSAEGGAEGASLEAALKEFAERHKLAEDAVYTVLPRHNMTVRILQLPTHDPAEINGMVRHSVEDYVPFPAEELIIDQCVLRKTGDGHAQVLAVFAHRDVVETHLRLLHGAKVEPVRIFLSTACLVTAAMMARTGDEERYALVDLGSGGLEVLVMNGQRLEYGRAIASTQDWSSRGDEAAEVFEELSVELRASLSAYRRESEDGEEVDAVYLCSDWVDVTEHCETLTHEVGRECRPAAFARGLVTHGADQLPTLPLTSLGAALAAQGRAAVAINLLPGAVVEQRKRAGSRQQAVKFGSFAAAIAVVLIGLYAQAVYQRTGYVNELRVRIVEVEPRAQGILSKQKQLGILQRQVHRTGGVVELVAALCDLFPGSGMNITRFQFTHGERIDLWGRAKTLLQIETLARELNEIGKTAIPQFARAQQVYEKKVREKAQEVLNFKITLPFPESEEPEGGGSGLD